MRKLESLKNLKFLKAIDNGGLITGGYDTTPKTFLSTIDQVNTSLANGSYTTDIISDYLND